MSDDSQSLQVQVARKLVELSLQRSYMNTERTLAVWTRTALSLMIFGIAVDRFGLLMRHPPWHVVDARECREVIIDTIRRGKIDLRVRGEHKWRTRRLGIVVVALADKAGRAPHLCRAHRADAALGLR